jgi:hypothetical protein
LTTGKRVPTTGELATDGWWGARVGIGVPRRYRLSLELVQDGSCRWRFPASCLCKRGVYSQRSLPSWPPDRAVRARLSQGIDYSGMSYHAVDDGVVRMILGMFRRTRGAGLGNDDGRQPVVPVVQDWEEVAGRVRVAAHGEEAVDDEHVDLAEFVVEVLVADCRAAGGGRRDVRGLPCARSGRCVRCAGGIADD